MTERVPERSWLGGALSMEFPDCSIAAADLCMQAKQAMDRGYKGTVNNKCEYYLAGDYVSVDKDTEQLVTVRETEDFHLDGYKSTVVLFQPIELYKAPSDKETEKKVKKGKGWFAHTVTVSVVEEIDWVRRSEEPMLAIIVGKDTLLPLASFAVRTNGNCSYVQLGHEMKDDDFYATAADDQSARLDLVESLRQMVGNKGPLSDEQRITIQNFINEQADVHRAELNQIYERQLVNEAMKRVNRSKPTELTVLRDDSDRPARLSYKTYGVTVPAILPDGRLAKLALVGPELPKNKPLDSVELVAITRADMAVTLANLSQLYGNVDFVDDKLQAKDERQKIIRDLLFALVERPKIGERLNSNSGHYSAALGISSSNGANPIEQVHKEFIDQLNIYFAYPDSHNTPTIEGMDIVTNNLTRLQQPAQQLMAQLEVQGKLADLLGPPRPCDERFVHFVHWFANIGHELQATFADMVVSSTISDTVIAADIKRCDNVYELKFTGRPISMPHEPMRQLGPSIWVNPMEPYLGHAQNEDDLFSSSNVNEWTGYLSHIIASQDEKIPPNEIWF